MAGHLLTLLPPNKCEPALLPSCLSLSEIRSVSLSKAGALMKLNLSVQVLPSLCRARARDRNSFGACWPQTWESDGGSDLHDFCYDCFEDSWLTLSLSPCCRTLGVK